MRRPGGLRAFASVAAEATPSPPNQPAFRVSILSQAGAAVTNSIWPAPFAGVLAVGTVFGLQPEKINNTIGNILLKVIVLRIFNFM